MTRWGSFLWAACVAITLPLAAVRARAERVALVGPEVHDEPLRSAFVHLKGELAVQRFEVVVVDRPSEATPAELARLARETSASAAIVLFLTQGVASARVFLTDEEGGQTLLRTLTSVPRAEGPSVLAVRVVDYLRAKLREAPSEATPSVRSDERPVDAGETEGHAPEVARTRRFSLEADFVLQLLSPRFGPAYGASLSLGYHVLRWLALRIVAQAPLRGARHESGEAAASLSQEQMMAELGVRAYEGGPFSLWLFGAAGAHHVSVKGEARPPYRPERDAAWTALFGAGVGASVRLSPAFGLSLRARSFVLAPRPVVQVADERIHLGRPAFQVTGGFSVAL